MFFKAQENNILRNLVLASCWILLGVYFLGGLCSEKPETGLPDFGQLDSHLVIEVVKGSEIPTEFPASSGEFEYKSRLGQERNGEASSERFVYLLRPFGGGFSYSSSFEPSLNRWVEENEVKELSVWLDGTRVTSWGTIEGENVESLSPRELVIAVKLLEDPERFNWSRERGLVWKINPWSLVLE